MLRRLSTGRAPRERRSERSEEVAIRSDLIRLTKEEIDRAEACAPKFSDSRGTDTFLSEHNFKMEMHDGDTVTLARRAGHHMVVVQFSTIVGVDDDGDGDDEDDDDEHSAIDEFRRSSAPSSASSPSSLSADYDDEHSDELAYSSSDDEDDHVEWVYHPIEAIITTIDISGLPQRSMWLEGSVAGDDGSLFIESIVVTDGVVESADDVDKEDAIAFDELSPPIRRRLYDYLAHLGIGDECGAFVRSFVATHNHIRRVDRLTSLRSWLEQES
jgi:Mitochondrial glycoprotein